MSEIPPAVLDQLNRGEIASANLVESLAINQRLLLKHALNHIGLRGSAADDLLTRAAELEQAGIMQRIIGHGRLLHIALAEHRDAAALREKLSSHTSDTVRSWVAFMLLADDTLSLDRRLNDARRFAADPHMGVRECAWMTIRPHLARELDAGLRSLVEWTADPDPNIRRCASEATRPRGVWCAHIEALKRDPSPALIILEPLRSDLSRYVQNSVANWINDASKTAPKWARETCARWKRESRTAETAYIIKRGLRTIRR